MANRIGKYKVSKKESELSIADGGTVNGDLFILGLTDQAGAATTSNKVFITGSSGITGSGTSYKVLCIG